MFTKTVFGVVIALLLPVTALAGADNFQYFVESQSIGGPTGNIQTPSTRVLPEGKWSFGLHRFIVGVNYGLLPNLEAGLSFDLKELTPLFPMDQANIERKQKEISVHSKYRILREEEHPLDVSVGQRRDLVYLACGKYFRSLWDTCLQGGLAWRDNGWSTFFSLNRVTSTEQFMLDFEPAKKQMNLGWRFLVSPEMKLDFFLMDVTHLKNIFLDNFMFGLTLAG